MSTSSDPSDVHEFKCAACGHVVPFPDGSINTEAICPGCTVLVRRRSKSDTMAIPVSMELPEEFEPADLGQVPKLSNTLINRYQKNRRLRVVETGDPLSDSNHALARAIERLAGAIEGGGLGGLVAGLQNGQERETHNVNAAPTSDTANPLINAEENYSEFEETEEPIIGDKSKADPLGAAVLVRREAAVEAHRFQRTSQAHTDIKGQQQSKLNRWVQKHPFTMMTFGGLLVTALITFVFLLMNGFFDPAPESIDDETVALLAEGNPDVVLAEKEARGFLNAGGLPAALPYIYNGTGIMPKLERFYEPLSDNVNYGIKLTRREKTGNRSAYFYDVQSGGNSNPLVVLQERSAFKVFWEYGAEIGDLNWESFLRAEPSDVLLMRVFIRPDNSYDNTHPSKEWSSWLAQDWKGQYSLRVFAKRNDVAHRRLEAVVKNYPVIRNGSEWAMVQARLRNLQAGQQLRNEVDEVVEAVDIPLGSWLPEAFAPNNTFYSRQDEKGGRRRRTLFEEEKAE